MSEPAYGPEAASRDLARVREGAASFNARARLERFLLTLLNERGEGAVSSFLLGLPDHGFRLIDAGASGTEARYVSEGPEGRRLVVTTFSGSHSASVNVALEEERGERPDADPRHRAFYEVWESLLGLPDSEVPGLDPRRKAVFLIALLEAEVMNGGFGQYLANTGGVRLEDTLQCLATIGAEKTRALLLEAEKLASDAESYTVAWDSRSEEFQRLDERFLESGEDLAGLTVDALLEKEP